MAVGDSLREIPPFKADVTPSSDIDPGRDTEIFVRQVEDYLKRLREALLADLEGAESRIEALEP